MASNVTKLKADDIANRPLPNNIEAEQNLLGAILMDNEIFTKVGATLEPEDFYDPVHQRVYEAIQMTIEANRVATPVTMGGLVGEIDGLGMTPGQYLARLCAEAVAPNLAVGYAKVVKDLSIHRQAFNICSVVQRKILETAGGGSPSVLIDEAEAELSAIRPTAKGSAGQFQPFYMAARRAVLMAQTAYQQGEVLSGLSTGLTGLDEQLGGLQRSDVIVVAGRPGMGKQQSVDCMVYTPAGAKRIGDIRVGDMVLGGDGKPVEVTGVFPQGDKPSYRVWFTDGASTECGPEHLWAAKTEQDRRKRKDWRVVSLEKIMARGLETKKASDRPNGKRSFNWSIPLCGPASFTGAVDIVPPYMLGVLIGDGALTCGAVFSTPDIDVDIVQRVAQQADAMGYRVARNDAPACPQYRIAVDAGKRNPLCQWLKDAGLAVLSGARFIPQEYLLASEDARRDLLAGLLDTDGSAANGRAEFCTTSPRLADDMQFLVRSLGGLCRRTSHDRSHHGKSTTINLRITLPFNPFRSVRKAAQWREPIPAKFKRAIERVEFAGIKEQVCIQVARPDGLYLTDCFIVTHNTSLACNISLNVARDLRERRQNGEKTGVVAFFSLEMSEDQLANRMIAEVSKVSGWRIRKGKVTEREMEDFAQAAERLENLPIHIDPTGQIPLAALLMRARNLHKKLGIELVVVDYLGLIKAPQRGREANRVAEVTEITGALKGLAKELDVPVIALSQLSRKVEERDDKRPMLSDLRDSGSIEQDADSVIFCYRDEYYLAKKEPPFSQQERHTEWALNMDRVRGRAELIVGKNRHGPEGTVHLGFNNNLTQFNNDLPDADLLQKGDAPKEKKERPKPLRLLPEAAIALKRLQTLVLTSSVENDGKVPNLPNHHKVVPYVLWKERVLEELADPEASDTKNSSRMEKIFTNLIAPGNGHGPQIGRAGSKSEPWCWVVEKRD